MLGDGGTSGGPSAQHAYGLPGSYTATFVTSDGAGNSASQSRTACSRDAGDRTGAHRRPGLKGFSPLATPRQVRLGLEPMGADPVDVVRSMYEAFAAGDAERIADQLHTDVELIDPDLPGGGKFNGIDGVFDFLRLWGEPFSELHIEVEELIPIDRRVLAIVHQYGLAAASGAPVDMRDAHLWTIERGLVTRIQLFLSREAALAAAERS